VASPGESFEKILITFTTAFNNPGLSKNGLKKFIEKYEFNKVEKLAFSDEKIEKMIVDRIGTVIPAYSKNNDIILKAIALNKGNSVAYATGGMYIETVSSYPLTVKSYQTIEGQEYPLDIQFKMTVLYWVDDRTIILTVILEPEKTMDSENIIRIEHPRGIRVSLDTINKLGEKVPIYTDLAKFIKQKDETYLGILITELYISLIISYVKANPKMDNIRMIDISDLRKKAIRIFRTITFTTVILSCRGISQIVDVLPGIFYGYSNFNIKNSLSFIEQQDISDTPDTRILQSERKLIVVLDLSAISRKIRADPLNWLIWGILTGEFTSTMTLFLDIYQQIPYLINSRNKLTKISQMLGETIMLTSKLSNPNFIQTPLLRKLINYSSELNHFNETLEKLKSDFNVLKSMLEQKIERRLSYMLLLATILVLFSPLFVLSHWLFLYLAVGISAVIIIYLLPKSSSVSSFR